MDYKETLTYLFSRLPMYQRIGKAAYKADLNNTIALDTCLNHPHKNFRSVHVAGTNGKGSVSHMLSSVFQEAGYKTGLYTSPHLLDFRERIRVNGVPVSEEFVVAFTQQIHTAIETYNPSFFEITVAMAFDYFSQQQVDVTVIETGLGGRLDSTNIITPLLSVITNISLEHQNLLGDTIEKIAAEKGGIIKQNIPVVIGKRHEKTDRIFIEIGNLKEVKPVFAEDYYKAEFKGIHDDKGVFTIMRNGNSFTDELISDLSGWYQCSNIATVLKCLDILKQQGFAINDDSIRRGFISVAANTDLHGRWEKISGNPYIFCDIAHNPEAIKNMLLQLSYYSYRQLHLILGFSSDKDYHSILDLLPRSALYYFCKPSVERGLDADQLQQMAESFGLNGISYHSVGEGIMRAISLADEDDLILITGSAFVVADALLVVSEIKNV